MPGQGHGHVRVGPLKDISYQKYYLFQFFKGLRIY